MIFNEHSNLRGQHAFLSASQYHWINYDLDKLASRYFNHLALAKGTELHEVAAKLISLGIKLPNNKKTLNRYVNDAIGFKMTPEQVLYFSDFCFGTADAISFKRKTLRIHDLKTGVTKASMHQLEIYAALFCLEYGVSPYDIFIELRIYQSDEVLVENPEADYIQFIMDKIVDFDMELTKLSTEDIWMN